MVNGWVSIHTTPTPLQARSGAFRKRTDPARPDRPHILDLVDFPERRRHLAVIDVKPPGGLEVEGRAETSSRAATPVAGLESPFSKRTVAAVGESECSTRCLSTLHSVCRQDIPEQCSRAGLLNSSTQVPSGEWLTIIASCIVLRRLVVATQTSDFLVGE